MNTLYIVHTADCHMLLQYHGMHNIHPHAYHTQSLTQIIKTFPIPLLLTSSHIPAHTADLSYCSTQVTHLSAAKTRPWRRDVHGAKRLRVYGSAWLQSRGTCTVVRSQWSLHGLQFRSSDSRLPLFSLGLSSPFFTSFTLAPLTLSSVKSSSCLELYILLLCPSSSADGSRYASSSLLQ